MKEPIDNNQYFAGPLNMNRRTKQADTVMGTELDLDDYEFAVLDLLVVNENETLTFDELFEAVWRKEDNRADPDTARFCLHNLISKVNSAGEGFMLIDRDKDCGYVFRTFWGQSLGRTPEKNASVPGRRAFSGKGSR